MVAYNNLSWGYWHYDFAPSISRYKWLEPRHMVHISDRWRTTISTICSRLSSMAPDSRAGRISGHLESMTPRDAESLRRIATIERAYAPLLNSQQWEPHTYMQRFGVSEANGRGVADAVDDREPNHYTSQAATAGSLSAKARYFDLWHGLSCIRNRKGSSPCFHLKLKMTAMARFLKLQRPMPHSTSC